MLFVFTCLFSAQDKVISVPGKAGDLFFDSNGNLVILYATSQGDLRFLKREKGQVTTGDMKYHQPENEILSISTKKDRVGKTWVVWEERGMERSDIYLAPMEESSILNPVCLTSDEKGFNFSPVMGFSSANDLYTAWVNYNQGETKILVKNVSTQQTWRIHSYSGLDPQILTGKLGEVWLFWAGQLRNHDEILYTVYDRGAWTKTSTLNQSPDVPHINPSVVTDDRGFIHAVWSAYDGEDYELYYSTWSGLQWSPERKVTDNIHTADVSPCMTLFYGEVPAVAWIKSVDGRQEVWLNYKRGESWSQGIKIYESDEVSSPLKIISSQEMTWVLWQSKNLIQAAPVNNYRLQEYFFSQKKGTEPVYESQDLNTNKYIGFGDSITYGIIHLQPAPDKGYVPRLQNLIRSNINPNAVVLNRGQGGEKTSEGLSRISSVINSDQAKTIFLMEGTNDIKDFSISIDSAAYNLQQMANRCVNFNMKTFLSTIIPRQRWGDLIKSRIYALNSRINSIASSPSIHFVNNFNAFFYYPGGWTTLYSDTTHPNETGYQVMAQTWYNALVSTLPPIIKTNKNSLYFQAEITQTEVPAKEFSIKNAGGGKLVYDISTNKDWLSVSPSSGDSSGEWDPIEVTVDISGLTYGMHDGKVTITSNNATNSPQQVDVDLFIELPPLYPPVNFQGRKEENRSLSLREYVNVLTWEANDQNEDIIEAYRIYLIKDEGPTFLKQVSIDTFEYWDRDVDKDKTYKYGIKTLDSWERESEFVYTEIK